MMLTFLQVQVLSRDIRSLHHRQSQAESDFSVTLLGLRLEYVIAHGRVQLTSAVVSSDIDALEQAVETPA
jgi:hypothetical protein